MRYRGGYKTEESPSNTRKKITLRGAPKIKTYFEKGYVTLGFVRLIFHPPRNVTEKRLSTYELMSFLHHQLESNRDATEIDFSQSAIDDETAVEMIKLLKSYPNITSINFANNDIGAESLRFLLTTLPAVKSLSLEGNRKIRDKEIFQVISMPNLISLSISAGYISEELSEALSKWVPEIISTEMERAVAVGREDKNIEAGAIARRAQAIRTELKLVGSDSIRAKTMEALAKNRKISKLTISGAIIRDDILGKLKNMTELKHLDISGIRITDEGLATALNTLTISELTFRNPQFDQRLLSRYNQPSDRADQEKNNDTIKTIVTGNNALRALNVSTENFDNRTMSIIATQGSIKKLSLLKSEGSGNKIIESDLLPLLNVTSTIKALDISGVNVNITAIFLSGNPWRH